MRMIKTYLGGLIMSHEVEHCKVNETTIRTLKNGSGDPLFFLHGIRGLENWDDVFRSLSERYTVYCPEHPGYGASDDHEDLNTVEDIAYFYLDLFDQLGLDKVSLIGSSIGGWIAVELAIIAPHRIKQLILVNSTGIRFEDISILDLFIM